MNDWWFSAGFFPHGYLHDGQKKPDNQIIPGADEDFKLYFDARLTADQARSPLNVNPKL